MTERRTPVTGRKNGEEVFRDFRCINCGVFYPEYGFPHNCPECGGLFDRIRALRFNPLLVDRSQPGIWRYRHALGISAEVEAVSLGEGNTPLLWVEVMGHRVAFKCEDRNPSGSFKDRGSAIICALFRAQKIQEAAEDSSGNAGASFAAYAARAGILAHIFVPASTAGAKRMQIQAYGAHLVPVSGSRSKVTEAVKQFVDGGIAYASHAALPFNLPGYATAAYEIYEQLGERLPGAVIVPAGQGGLLLGLHRGFKAISTIHRGLAVPRMIGVQARACAPLWSMYTTGHVEVGSVEEHDTLAEGVRVRYPLRAKAVMDAVRNSRGQFIAVEEAEILSGRDALARKGLYVEPTSAIVWSALKLILKAVPGPVVVILTGTGYKSV